MRFLAIALILFRIALETSLAEQTRFAFVEKQMGADFRIVLYADSEKLANEAATAAFAEVERLNSILSDYDPESELSRLSDTSGSGQHFPLSDDLFAVLDASQKLSLQTGGAFDVTIGPCVRLWRIARFRKSLPVPEKLAEARKAVGFRHLDISNAKHTAHLEVSNMVLDLGGIAKGYVADKALMVLRKRGVGSALVDAGGDLALGDPPPGRKGWRIEIGGLKHRDLPVLELARCAIATSGDVEQFVEIDGQRYSHLIDPGTGVGLTTRIQVTVVTFKGMQADSLASALSVLGTERGTKFVQKLSGVRAYFVEGVGDQRTLCVARGK
jgi:thiamine biosynthesis lipoprotein